MAHGSYRPNKLESPAINQNCFQCRTEWTVLTTCTFNEIKPGYYGLTSLRFHSDAHCFLILQLYPAEGESEILSAGAISCYKAFFFFALFESRLHWTHSAFYHLHEPTEGSLSFTKQKSTMDQTKGLGFLHVRYWFHFKYTLWSSQFQYPWVIFFLYIYFFHL